MRSFTVLLVLLPSLARAVDLEALERRFYEDWKNKRLTAVEQNLSSDSIAWGEWGIFSKQQQVESQRRSNAVCEVRSYRFSEIKTIPVNKGAILFTYRLEQDAQCGGGAAPSPIRISTLYVKRNGKWQAIYRASTGIKG